MWPEADQTHELLDQARAGNGEAVNSLLQRHRDALRRMVDLRIDRALSRRVDASDVVQDVLLEANTRLEEYLKYVVPYYIAEGKSYLTVAIGCTGGRHRSVMIAERLRKALADAGVARVRVRHRDIGHA